MRIEDCWKDGIEYYVRFETKAHRYIEKIIILPGGTTPEQAEKIVMSSFNNIERVVDLDERVDILTYISV